MAQIGNVITRAGQFKEVVANIPTDESVGGILFDISGFTNPFNNFRQVHDYFGNNKIQLVSGVDDLNKMGIRNDGTSGFLNGLAYYHLSSFFKYAGDNSQLYVSFVDCSKDWDFIVSMQRAVNGRMFQLGIWTHQPLWEINEITAQLEFTKLAINIESTVEELTGKVGQPSGSPTPLSIILSANTSAGIRNFTLRKLPNGTVFNAPKVSVLLCQNGSDEVHAIQQLMPNNTPVGSIGYMMAVLSLAGAEENVGGVNDFNLNKYDDFQLPEIPVNDEYIPLENVNKIVQNILMQNGYIIPTTYPAKEGECFFGGDPTLSSGDYSIISNNRVIHKCRRCVFSVLLPYLHSNQLYDSSSKGLSRATRDMFEEAIGSALSGKLINKGGKYQINGYQIVDFETSNILNDDTVNIRYTVSPVNYNGKLTETVFAV